MLQLWNPDLLEKLCAAPGIAGFESIPASLVAGQLKEWGIPVRRDGLGGLTAHIPGPGPRLALVAHLDEVGLLVRKIHHQGFLFVERVGGAAAHVLPGLRVDIWAGSMPVPGVVGAMPQHLVTNGNSIPLSELFVDAGCASREQALNMGIEVGSMITYSPGLHRLGDRIASKAMDDRLGCHLLLRLAQSLKDAPPPVDLYLVFDAQEETLVRGAEPAINEIAPDYVVGVDGTLSFDTPDLPNSQCDLALGEGPAIKVMDHIRGGGMGLVAHPGLRRFIEGLASQAGISFQREVITGISTAVSPLVYLGRGLPVGAVSFPLRYTHSPVETADLADVESVFQLLLALAQNPWRPEA